MVGSGSEAVYKGSNDVIRGLTRGTMTKTGEGDGQTRIVGLTTVLLYSVVQ